MDVLALLIGFVLGACVATWLWERARHDAAELLQLLAGPEPETED